MTCSLPDGLTTLPLPQIDFQLLRQGGMMKAFEGHWTVQPWDGSLDLDRIVQVGL